ncbi:hypothetical protein [Lichenihabitans psoromatis]|uniref:hypothetical protein n=1 Tax=Lichenihabitans psoromatis TaxID=2528642 RepID=UPI001038585C|nr:hypothetical protein [Lichenihabitans psoromatis]
MSAHQRAKDAGPDRWLLITNMVLWAAFTLAALAFALLSLSMLTGPLTYRDYLTAIGARWDGEWFYFFGPTVLQTIIFALHLTLILRWKDLARWTSQTAWSGRMGRPTRQMTEATLRRIISLLPLLAFLNAVAMCESLATVRRLSLHLP